jgi:KUP system potassium uptake protein
MVHRDAALASIRTRAAPAAAGPRAAIFLNRGKQSAPLAMRANVEQNQVRHQHVVNLSIETLPVPRVPDAGRIVIDNLGYAGDGIVHVSARFGYMQTPDVPRALRLLNPEQAEGLIDTDGASYFLSKIELAKGDAPTMARWRKRLFIATSYLTADAAEYFGLPRNRSVIMGSRIEV